MLDLPTVLPGPFVPYWMGVGGDDDPKLQEQLLKVLGRPVTSEMPALVPEPISNYWMFNATLAGGLGAYGMPTYGHPPSITVPSQMFPDRREIRGEVVAKPDGKHRAKLTLRKVEFHVWDAFDFIPGNLGSWPLPPIITEDLQYLEFYNRAYDVSVYIHWKHQGEIDLGSVEVSGLDCGNQPTDLRPAVQKRGGQTPTPFPRNGATETLPAPWLTALGG